MDAIAIIRTTHFWLTVASIAMLASVSLDEKPQVEKALEQLERIQRIVDCWESTWIYAAAEGRKCKDLPHIKDEEFLDRSENTTITKSLFISDRPIVTLHGMNYNDHVHFEVPTTIEFYGNIPTILPPESLYATSLVSEDVENEGPCYGMLRLKAPTSLSQYIELWDSLGTTKIRKSSPSEYIAIAEKRGSGGDKDSSRGLLKIGEENEKTKAHTYAFVENGWCTGSISPDARTSIVFIARSGRGGEGVPFFLQVPDDLWVERRTADLFNAYYDERFRPISFSEHFKELEEVTRPTASLPFSQIRNILESEGRRSEGQLELFGTKMPTGAIAIWGPLVLLIIQTYLLLHFRYLRQFSTDITTQATVWIGLYEDLPARVVSFLSAALFPLFASGCILYVRWTEVTNSDQRVVPLIAVGALSLVSACMAWSFVRLWRAQ